MLLRLSDKPVVFLPTDRNVVYEHCKELYRQSPSVSPEAADGASEKIRKYMFSVLGGNRPAQREFVQSATGKRPLRMLVFRYDAVGDYIVTTPFLRYMSDMIPGLEIDVVASTRNVSMIQRDPFVSETVAIHPGHAFHPSWFSVKKHVARRPPDIVAALVFTKMTKAAILTSFAGPQAYRVTIEHASRRETYGKVFDLQVPHNTARQHYMETMTSVGAAILSTPMVTPQPYVVLEPEATKITKQRLASSDCCFALPSTNGIVGAKHTTLDYTPTTGCRYVVLNVSAFSPNRKWYANRACEVAKQLVRDHNDIVCFVTGGPEDAHEISSAVHQVKEHNVRQWTGTMAEFSALLVGAALVISPDTAAIHMAAAAGVRVVGLYAELIKVAEWFPYNTQYRILLSPDPHTINAIPCDFVATNSMEML